MKNGDLWIYGGFARNRLEDPQAHDTICHTLTNINIQGRFSQENSALIVPSP